MYKISAGDHAHNIFLTRANKPHRTVPACGRMIHPVLSKRPRLFTTTKNVAMKSHPQGNWKSTVDDHHSCCTTLPRAPVTCSLRNEKRKIELLRSRALAAMLSVELGFCAACFLRRDVWTLLTASCAVSVLKKLPGRGATLWGDIMPK